MKSIKIPKIYTNPLVVATLLRENLDEWTQRSLRLSLARGKLRDPELEELYHRIVQNFAGLEQYCSSKPFKYVIKSGDTVKVIGVGPEILWDDDKKSIIFDKFHMYPIPKGINHRHIYVTDFVAAAGLTDRHWDPKEWKDQLLDLESVDFLEQLFGISIQIWEREYSQTKGQDNYSLYYLGSVFSAEEYFLHLQAQTGLLLFIDDPDKYFSKYFICTNENCFFQFRSQQKLDQHSQLCGQETTRIVQEELGLSGKLVKKAEDHGLIPKLGYNRNFLFFDIESTLPRSTVCTQRTKVMTTHELVSIAANR